MRRDYDPDEWESFFDEDRNPIPDVPIPDEMNYVGVNIGDGVIAHVRPDVSRETLEALRVLAQKAKEAYERGEL